ncbi:MAG: penicillin-binding transpeptidase domain-containing protein [Collinsella sp.]
MTGTNGSLVRERARDGSYIAGGAYKKVAAVDGVDIVTTLDVNIQRAAEDALAEAVEKTKAKNGSALVTDPTTGEILAACSYPTYDQTDLENAKTEDMNLRLVTDAYEPGSVFRRSWPVPASTWAPCVRVRRLRCRRALRSATTPLPTPISATTP